ncbi:uncharacterized protein LOC133842920 [Drosophila sulfurigaster albostrigata]|uniref:uncharacterized protein LOC133842920 n=1 Tax=Drosophila sulfurigaster albostrigata TaxID=89887 RepID=UPI002D219A48|nr:uncharacterized protein LOC133842920 [Drosophila sulfurigaster albostrigata]XP_062132210.1 uncharacterized protein LOC133842920 [Drosophila sulfurigaster albostrigata]
MAEDSITIQMWAVFTARISVLYSVIYIGIEFINALHHTIPRGMLVIWLIVYAYNVKINFYFAGCNRDWEKSYAVIWFWTTIILLVVRLLCTNYRNLSGGMLAFAIFVNIFIVFSIIISIILGYKLNKPKADTNSSKSYDPVENRIVSVTTDETNIEDLSDNLRSAIGSYHTNLHNASPTGGVIGSSSSNLNYDSQIVFGTAPALNDLNNDPQINLAIAPDSSDLNNDSHNTDRSSHINVIVDVNDPPPSYDYVMTPKSEKEKV